MKLNSFVIGMGLLSVPTFSLLVSSLLFICGLSINPFIFPLSIGLSMLLMYFASKKNRKEFFGSALVCLLIVILSIIVATLSYDYSWDGQTYHQDTILQLKSGWNPVYDHHAPNAKPVLAIWVNHYAKGLETIASTIYSTTGDIEAGKAVNFILVLASGFLFFAFLKTCFVALSLKKKIFLSFLFSLCPIIASQILTYYIDWAAYSLLLVLVPSLICFLKEKYPKYNLLIISFVIILAATIKFNLLFWVLFTIFLYLIYAIVIKKYQLLKSLIITCAVSGVFAFFIAGFNPYVTNTVDHKNPLYPLVGEDKVDIMIGVVPSSFQHKSGFENIFISLFSFPSNSAPIIPLPFFVKPADFKAYGISDLRIGGFGAFFSWALVLSSILYAIISFHKNGILKDKEKTKFDVFLLILFLSLFILPHAWWARYFPFFYAFPLVMLLYSETNKKNRYLNIFRNSIYILLTINIMLFSLVALKAKNYTTKIRQSVNTLSKSKEPVLINFDRNVAFKIKLDKEGVKYIETSEQLGTCILDPFVFLDPAKYEVKNDILSEIP